MAAVSSHDHGATLSIQAQPRASRTDAVCEQEGWLKVRVAAPPVDGAANAETISWLSKKLKVPKSRIELLSGERGRKKIVLIQGVTVTEVTKALHLA